MDTTDSRPHRRPATTASSAGGVRALSARERALLESNQWIEENEAEIETTRHNLRLMIRGNQRKNRQGGCMADPWMLGGQDTPNARYDQSHDSGHEHEPTKGESVSPMYRPQTSGTPTSRTTGTPTSRMASSYTTGRASLRTSPGSRHQYRQEGGPKTGEEEGSEIVESLLPFIDTGPFKSQSGLHSSQSTPALASIRSGTVRRTPLNTIRYSTTTHSKRTSPTYFNNSATETSGAHFERRFQAHRSHGGSKRDSRPNTPGHHHKGLEHSKPSMHSFGDALKQVWFLPYTYTSNAL